MVDDRVIKEQELYQNLQERYNEACDYLQDLIKYQETATRELKYLNDFIHYKKLDEEFTYFLENAVEDTDSELPFPYMTIK